VQADEATLAVMQRHLLRSTGTDALDCLLSWCTWEFGEQEPPAAAAAAASEAGAAAASAAVVSFSSPAERAALVKSLPPEVGQPLGRALEAVNGTDVQVGVGCLLPMLWGFLCRVGEATGQGGGGSGQNICAAVVSFSGAAKRAALVKSLPPEVGQPLGKALEAVNGADVQVGRLLKQLRVWLLLCLCCLLPLLWGL
jgi:hypothetical protein